MKTLLLTTAVSLLVATARADGPTAGNSPAAGEQPAQASGKAFLGVGLASEDGLVRVNDVVPASPADRAGITKGAAIYGVDGELMKGPFERVQELVGAKKPGDTIELLWSAGGGLQTSDLTLGTLPVVGDVTLEAVPWTVVPKFGIPSKDLVDSVSDPLEGPGPALPHINGPALQPDGGTLNPAARQMRRVPPEVRRAVEPLAGAGAELRFSPLPNRSFEPSARPRATVVQGREGREVEAVWDSVRSGIASSLERSDVEPAVKEKVMAAVEQARQEANAARIRLERVEAETRRLDEQIRQLEAQKRALRQELEAPRQAPPERRR